MMNQLLVFFMLQENKVLLTGNDSSNGLGLNQLNSEFHQNIAG